MRQRAAGHLPFRQSLTPCSATPRARANLEAGPQNFSFSANWIWRAEPKSPAGLRVPTSWPKLPTVQSPVLAAGEQVDTGLAKFGRFRRLKNSLRNSSLTRSVIAVLFSSEKSQSKKSGPVMLLRRRLPNFPVGLANAAGFRNCPG